MQEYLPFIQIIVSIVLIVLILIQQRGTALGSAFGQDGGGFYSTRRGIQKKLLWATIIGGVIFIFLALLNLFL